MNNLLRITFRANGLRSVLNPIKKAASISNITQQTQLARNLWSLSNIRESNRRVSQLCTCGCMQKKGAHSKAERELVEFLTEEILAERKAQKTKTLPTEIDGFKANLNGAEVTFTKQDDDEKIKITFIVNHTVDTDIEPDLQPNSDKPELGELKSKPEFTVEMTRGNTTFAISCSFVGPNQQQEEGFHDIFGIDEMSIYDGDHNEKTYAVSGEVLDSYLYDLLMNYLEEKGISNEFVEKLSNFSTSYEHSAYIGLLEGLSKYASGK